MHSDSGTSCSAHQSSGLVCRKPVRSENLGIVQPVRWPHTANRPSPVNTSRLGTARPTAARSDFFSTLQPTFRIADFNLHSEIRNRIIGQLRYGVSAQTDEGDYARG